jgi:hypothetical protein
MPPRTGAKLDLGGETVTLRYTAPALGMLEDKRNEPLQATLQAAGTFSVRAIAALVWAGLLHTEPAPSLAQVTARIEPPVMPYMTAVMEALKPWTEEPVKEGSPEGNADATA